jgi:hypothetical protein
MMKIFNILKIFYVVAHLAHLQGLPCICLVDVYDTVTAKISLFIHGLIVAVVVVVAIYVYLPQFYTGGK